MPRGPNRPYPVIPLKHAMLVANGISENNAGKPINRVLLAEAMGYTASGGQFREIITASGKFGLTKGSYAADAIELTDLGRRVVRPVSDSDRLGALRDAMRNIPLFEQLLGHYQNNKLPAPDFLKNILEREPFLVDRTWSEEAVSVFIETGRFVGLIRDTKGGPYVLLDAGPQAITESSAVTTTDDTNVVARETPRVDSHPDGPLDLTPPSPPAQPTQFFVAHGRDETALTQLKDMLTKLTIPFVVAKEEPHGGRPISQKVADLMKSCTGGIFIFSGDDEISDAKGGVKRMPRMNVVFELGAASLLYGQKIVIFKEQGVDLPTDFRDLGYIEYKSGELSAKTMDLMLELIKLQALKLVPTST